jgi:hypothetical protein
MKIESRGNAIRTLRDWETHAPPKKGQAHWVDGRSAKECARAWCGGPDGPALPGELRALLDSHEDTRGAEVEEVTPEHRVRFDDLRGEPRNADVVAIASHPAGRIAISIEAKADEAFDRPVGKVLAAAARKTEAEQRTNAATRVKQLVKSLLPPAAAAGDPSVADGLRYQLLTGVAGTLAYAREVGASRAVFIVHEFASSAGDARKRKRNADDLDAFVAALTDGRVGSVPVGQIIGPLTVPGAPLFQEAVPLYIGKARRELASE